MSVELLSSSGSPSFPMCPAFCNPDILTPDDASKLGTDSYRMPCSTLIFLKEELYFVSVYDLKGTRYAYVIAIQFLFLVQLRLVLVDARSIVARVPAEGHVEIL